MILRIFIVLLICTVATSTPSFSQFDTSSTIKQIDSLLENVQSQRTGKKIRTSDGGSENYYYRTDGSVYCIAVYQDPYFLRYYFVDKQLVKVSYGERKHRTENHYYFQKGVLFQKLEDSNLPSQNDKTLIENADILLSKS